jgi:hypothetical protein
MKNSFQQWEDAQVEEFKVPEEIEFNLVKQAEGFSFFGKVVELFVSNALNTVTNIIGGDAPNQSDGNNQRQDLSQSWRTAPSSYPSDGNTAGRGL